MDKKSKEIQKEKPSNSSSNINEKDEKLSEKKEDKKSSSISDSIGYNKQLTLSGDIQINSDNLDESETNQKNENKEEDFEKKISIDLSDVNKKKLHYYLNEDLIDAIDKSLDDPIDNQYISDLSHNENDTNYSQNNISNDNDILHNLSNVNNYQFYPQNINSIHNTISFFPKINKKNEEINVNNKNNNFIQNVNVNNRDENNNKDIKKLVDYFGNNNPLDAPVYIPQKFKSLKFNQNPRKIGGNDNNNINKDKNNIEDNNEDKKEEKCKKPFEIREGDWTCEFCYNLNFAFRTRCNRCGLVKDFMKIKNNLSINNNESYPDYQKNLFLGNNSNNAFQILNNNNLSNTSLFSPNISNYQ